MIVVSYLGYYHYERPWAARLLADAVALPRAKALSLTAAAICIWLATATRPQTPPPLTLLAPADSAAPVSVVEFGDFECSGCKMAGLELAKLKRDFPGRLNVEFINYPLCHDCNPDLPDNKHPNACLAAKIGIALKARGKFEAYSQKLYGESKLNEARLYAIVSELGEDAAEIRDLAASAETSEALRRDIAYANRIGVQATPTLVVDGQRVQGAASVAQLRVALETHTQFADAAPALASAAQDVVFPSVGSRATGSWATQTLGPSADLFNNPYYTCVRNFYVSTTGNDSNDGSAAHPWLTLQNADSAAGGRIAGDCINVAPGTYPAGVAPTHGGNLASSTGYVVWRCQTLDGCKITANGDPWNNAFRINADGAGPNYLMVDGFEFASPNYGVYAAAIITAPSSNAGSGAAKTMHHLWVMNSIIHGFGQGGIQVEGTDYQYFIHNKIYDNANSTCDAQGSGMGIVVPKAFNVTATADDKTNPNPRIGTFVNGSDFFHNVLEWNIVYNNALTQCGTVSNAYDTDGNNIILDTFNTWNGNSVTYPYQSLVAMNVVYNAGGGGIHVFSSNYATVANNTCYNNYLDPANSGSVRGCIDSAQSFGDTYINNIAVAIAAPHTTCSYGTAPYAMWNSAILGSPLAGNPADTFSHNITFMAGAYAGCNGEVAMFGADTYSTTLNKVNTNPLFTNVGQTSTGTETTPPVGADFTLQSGSPAIGYAMSVPYLPGVTDAGAYQTSSAATPPSITTQPVSKTVTAGQTATFTVAATGTAPLSYQWQKNGTAISGATSASYTTPATTTADSGSTFRCVVSNSAGSATSNSATLTVNAAPTPPAITTQPVSKTVTAGQTATFTVAATGTAPLSYQWQKNGTAISGATSASYTTPATTTADSGSTFRCVVSNAAGSATSNPAILTVNAVVNHPPVIGSVAANPNAALTGQNIAFSASATDPENDPLTYTWNFGDGSTGSGSTLTHAYHAAGTFTATVSVSDGHNPAVTSSVTVWITQSLRLSINSGGPVAGRFQADANFSGGSTYTSTHTIVTTGVTNPAPQSVYQTERNGNFIYTISGLTDGATYNVRLHFAELIYTQAGQRVFNVAIDGVRVLDSFDMIAAAGGAYIALSRNYYVVPVAGTITIQYTGVKGAAKSSGIEIITATAAPPPTTGGGALSSAQVTQAPDTSDAGDGSTDPSGDTPTGSIDLGSFKLHKKFKLKLSSPLSDPKARVSWSVVNRKLLPPGVMVAGGSIGGKPRKTGVYTFALRLKSSSKAGVFNVTNSYTITITP